MLKRKMPMIVGTTGFPKEDIEKLQIIAEENDVIGMIAPNFAIGVVLLQQFTKMATQYFDHFAIYEYHHLTKHDNPSGTALYLKDTIEEKEGTEVDVKGFRLPGVLATHTVIMSDDVQKVELTHQSNHRASFYEGVRYTLENLDRLDKLVYGLEYLME